MIRSKQPVFPVPTSPIVTRRDDGIALNTSFRPGLSTESLLSRSLGHHSSSSLAALHRYVGSDDGGHALRI
eukprot:scaffold421285_cov56-Attheya_sp.AAC.3